MFNYDGALTLDVDKASFSMALKTTPINLCQDFIMDRYLLLTGYEVPHYPFGCPTALHRPADC